MKIVASGAVLLLMISIVSFGMPTFANAQSAEFPLTVSTDYPGYAENGEIIISGQVKESSLSEYPTPVTLMVVSPDGNIVKIDQLNLNSNNEFSTTLVEYEGNDFWIEPVLHDIKFILESDRIPESSSKCQYCRYYNNLANVI